MHAQPERPLRSVWADLDALVLEEVEALRTEREQPAPPANPTFASDEDFLMRSLAYLALHPEPAALLERMRSGFLSPEPAAEEDKEAAADQEVEADPKNEPPPAAQAEARPEPGATPAAEAEDRQP